MDLSLASIKDRPDGGKSQKAVPKMNLKAQIPEKPNILKKKPFIQVSQKGQKNMPKKQPAVKPKKTVKKAQPKKVSPKKEESKKELERPKTTTRKK